MKAGFRQCMAWLHTWTGLVVGWVLFFVFVTGTAGYATYELDRWMRPELPLAAPAHVPQAQMLEQAVAFLETRAGGASTWTIQFPGNRSQPNLSVSWQTPPKEGEGRRGRGNRATLDAHTGEEIQTGPVRETGGGHLLYRMHYRLHYISYETALRFVGICTLLMFIAIISGVITHKKIFSDFFTFRPGKGQRSWLDAHNLISVMTLPFFVMITYSGLLFFMFQYMPLGVSGVYGTGEENARTFQSELYPRRFMAQPAAALQPATPAPLLPMLDEAERHWGAGQVQRIQIRQPYLEGSEVTVSRLAATSLGPSQTLKFDGISGDMIGTDTDESAAMEFRNVMFNLHEGHFAGPLLRWLYVLSGCLGAGIIATGLVLWTVKRRIKQDKLVKAGGKPEFGFRLVECLNIGSIAGLPLAIAVYFCANRLLPAAMETRREWEVHAMFIAWGVMLVYPALRTPMRAWIEELWLAAGVFMLLPLLNALTTQRHLGMTIPAGDWALASIDLTFAMLGVFFALTAYKVRRKLVTSQHPKIRAGRPASVPTPAIRAVAASAQILPEQT